MEGPDEEELASEQLAESFRSANSATILPEVTVRESRLPPASSTHKVSIVKGTVTVAGKNFL